MRLLILSIFIAVTTFSCKSTHQQAIEDAQSSVEAKNADRGNRASKGERRERPSVDEVFKMDVNNDGLLTKAEIGDSPLTRHFDNMDVNNDGAISKTEFENAPRPQRGKRSKLDNE